MRVCGEGVHSFADDGFSYVSVFSLTDSAEICANGLKYSGGIKLVSDFPLGVSNEFAEENAEISVRSGKILVILEK